MMARSSPGASACVLIIAAHLLGAFGVASAQEIVIGPYRFADETPFADAAAFYGNRSPRRTCGSTGYRPAWESERNR
jgi:hypothetical protein